jgi:hypothetical protein
MIAVAFSINAYTLVYTMIVSIYNLNEKGEIITPQSKVVYTSDTYEPGSIRKILSDIYRFSATTSLCYC